MWSNTCSNPIRLESEAYVHLRTSTPFPFRMSPCHGRTVRAMDMVHLMCNMDPSNSLSATCPCADELSACPSIGVLSGKGQRSRTFIVSAYATRSCAAMTGERSPIKALIACCWTHRAQVGLVAAAYRDTCLGMNCSHICETGLCVLALFRLSILSPHHLRCFARPWRDIS